MGTMLELLETYFTVLVHPFRLHQQFRWGLAMPGHKGHIYRPLQISEALGISWVFSVLRGLCKIIMLNFFLQLFLTLQSEEFPLIQELITSSGLSTYYFLLFSAALDIIFFPILAMVMTEVWAWVIRFFAKRLDPELPAEDIADQITTHALSSNVFYMVPFLGDLIQPLLYYFLIYAGLRSNLGATRSLSWVILLTPTLFAIMMLLLLLLIIFLFSQLTI